MTFSFGLVKIVVWLGSIGAVFLFYLYAKKIYDRYTDLKERADKSWRALEESMKKRAYEVGRLISLGDAYIKESCPELDKLKSFSRRFPMAPSQKEKINLSKEVPKFFDNFVQTAGKYPEVKNQHYFTEIQNRVAHITADIEKERLTYNQQAENINKKLNKLVFKILAKLSGVKPYEYYIIPKDAQKLTDVKFDLPMPPLG